jgi:mannosyltransferase
VRDPELIVTNMHRRYTGVSATIAALLPVQAGQFRLALAGRSLPAIDAMRVRAALAVSRRPPGDRPFRIWHVRRNNEMVAALFARDVLRLPVRIVFTTTSRRRHSFVPRRLIAAMDAVVATTQHAAEFVPHVAAVIPHGIDTARFSPPPDKAAAWAASGLPGRFGIGVVGRVRPQKGTDLFVQAMLALLPRHPDFTAVVIGRWSAADQAWQRGLAAQVAAAGLSDRILFLGEVPPDEMIAWYRRLAIVVTPARQEQFGLTPLEGMACGAAAVATRTGAFEELIEPGETGTLAAPGDAEALTAAIAPLLADPTRALAMGRAGRARALGRFSIAREAEGLAAVYRRLWDGERF